MLLARRALEDIILETIFRLDDERESKTGKLNRLGERQGFAADTDRL